MAFDPRLDKKTLASLKSMRDISRAYVYDLRHYTAETRWGPFNSDGSVNWTHVEHLINVVALNVQELPGSWALTRPPSCIDPPRISCALARRQISSTDWAGVEGTWRRYVCFMDYRDLFAFNFTDLADGPRQPKFFKDPRFREATRLIEVKIHLVPTTEIRFIRSSDLRPDEHDHYPPLCFVGSSKGVNGNEAQVEGYVRMGKDGIARWYLTSIYDDHPQWSSSGVQIGGLGSAMGVVGVWTTTHHDQDDPVGPFWLWKVEDNSPTHLMEYT
ncbi:hypothetical protein NLJ89_g3125 [Agrocybe chaxingu]|uniref:Uncharacterized protein n=1 Tax=Agrocybe chaxingu TaxID=84603 RepID=A0A9W8MVS7_9AGAR|nr:hypothetical protein NLJ89_g3125 [Agrocybe chaxingu]